MRYEAHTNYAQVAAGTRLHMLETPTVGGTRPTPLPAGIEITIHYPSGPVEKAVIESVSGTEAIFSLKKTGARWRMSHVKSGELGAGITSPGLHAQDWVVREQLEALDADS